VEKSTSSTVQVFFIAVAVHLEELRIGHGPQREAQARIEDPRGATDGQARGVGGAHWQASQLSGFSSEQATAASSE
jgi:hypothetical protein